MVMNDQSLLMKLHILTIKKYHKLELKGSLFIKTLKKSLNNNGGNKL